MAGPELLRRVLLGAVTALVVSRPLVLGELEGCPILAFAIGCAPGFGLQYLLQRLVRRTQ